MDIYCDAVTATTNLVGDSPGHRDLCLCAHGIANKLSLSKVIANNHLVFDGKIGNQFVVKNNFGRNSIFVQSTSGLYYLDTK